MMCFVSTFILDGVPIPKFAFATLVSVVLVSFAQAAPPKYLYLWFRSFTVFSCIVTG